jgi:hypothetical protein
MRPRAMNSASMAPAVRPRRNVSPTARRPIGALPWRPAVQVYHHKRVRRINAAIHSRPSNLMRGASQLHRVQGFCNLANFSGLPILYSCAETTGRAKPQIASLLFTAASRRAMCSPATGSTGPGTTKSIMKIGKRYCGNASDAPAVNRASPTGAWCRRDSVTVFLIARQAIAGARKVEITGKVTEKVSGLSSSRLKRRPPRQPVLQTKPPGNLHRVKTGV